MGVLLVWVDNWGIWVDRLEMVLVKVVAQLEIREFLRRTLNVYSRKGS